MRACLCAELIVYRGMGLSEGPGEHSMLHAKEASAREEHGDLKACRQLFSIRARIRNATICKKRVETTSTSTSTDPHRGSVQDSSTWTDSSLERADPHPETFSWSETTEEPAQVLAIEEDGDFTTPGSILPLQMLVQDHMVVEDHMVGQDHVVVQDHHMASEGEDQARDLDVQECYGDYLPKVAAKEPFGSCAVPLDEEEQQCRSASETALGLSRRLAGAESLRRKEVMMIMERLYRDHPGAVWRRTSREAIKAVESQGREPSSAKALIYGEISFIAFTKLLETYAPISSGFTFYDLGCGAGRPVFIASLLMTSCVKSCGIEIIPSMHQMNKELLQLYDVEVRRWLHPAKQVQDITFLCGDMLQVDWSDADVVFANATCFDDNLFESLEARAKNILKEGSTVIVVTRRFRSESVWELVNQTERRMSWSPAVVSIYRKKTQTSHLPTMVDKRE